MKARITVNVPRGQVARIRELAASWDCTFAEVVQTLLQAYADEEGITTSDGSE